MTTPSPSSEAERLEELLKEAEALDKGATAGPWHACGDPANQQQFSTGLTGDMPPMRARKQLCSCGQVWSAPHDFPVARVEGGTWGDSWPAIRTKEDGTLEPYMERSDYGDIPVEAQRANMAFVARARTLLPELAAACRALREKFIESERVSEGRRQVLLQWIRAENAEGRAEALSRENAELRKALLFYAKSENYSPEMIEFDGDHELYNSIIKRPAPVLNDNGTLARAALAPKETGK